MNRRAKIVCTLGPATRSAAAIRALLDAGMDVARLNFSHGTRTEHAEACARVRAAAAAAGRAVGVLADLQGPKIRLGRFAGGTAVLDTGAEFAITTEPCTGDARRACTDYAALARDLAPGDRVLLDDGRIRLETIAVAGSEVRTRVLQGGPISDHKGINLPGVRLSVAALTEKDREDLAFAMTLPVDLVALSFVRSAADADAVREALGERRVPVIAKLEKPEAVEDLEALVGAFDGLMVARGDLGVEMPLERVPLVQKRAVSLARERAKPVIVATEMLESMIHATRPTRAEASDVANAVLDGADALMLSGETSVGEHPARTVETMARVIAATEAEGLARIAPLALRAEAREDAIADAATRAAEEVRARAVVAFTRTGATARRLARYRSAIPLLAFTPDPAVRSRLALVWGVEAFVVDETGNTDAMVAQVDRAMLESGHGRPGDEVVIVSGVPSGAAGTTNMLQIHRLGGG